MMSEISYHQQQYIRHQKREKKLVLFLRIFILLFFLVLCQIITGLLKIKESISPVLAEISHNTRKRRRINIRKKRTSFFSLF